MFAILLAIIGVSAIYEGCGYNFAGQSGKQGSWSDRLSLREGAPQSERARKERLMRSFLTLL
jgi:hypothetical protein